MNDPKRYEAMGPEVIATPTGEFVRWEDYARLKAEAERYRLDSLRVDVGELHAQFNRALFNQTVSENTRLKAEVNRLADEVGLMNQLWEMYLTPEIRKAMVKAVKKGGQP